MGDLIDFQSALIAAVGRQVVAVSAAPGVQGGWPMSTKVLRIRNRPGRAPGRVEFLLTIQLPRR